MNQQIELRVASRDAPTGHKLFKFISTTFQSRRWAHIKRSAKIQMKKETRVAVGALAVCAAFWTLPLYRAVSYLLSLPSLISGQSIDETNDLHYGRELLFSYLACLLSSVFLGWLYVRRPRIMILAPIFLILGMAVRMIMLRPEEVIVFFPAIRPYQPAQIGLLAVLIGICFYMYSDSHANFDPS